VRADAIPQQAARLTVLAAVLLASTRAGAGGGDMSAAAPFGEPVDDDRVFVHALLDEFEGRFGSADIPFRWDGEAWLGTDTDRLWLKSEGFAVDGRLQDGEHELLYARAISSYFDLQAGIRYDLDSAAGRGWAAVGVEGLAPYFFHFSATLYASDAGHFAGKLLVSYEELLTQRLILEPLVELNAYTRPDPARDVGAGLSDLDGGLRLRYEISRKFAPYLGVVYQRAYGPSAADSLTGRGGDWRLALGIRAWF
jgi:copper resistance protein B